VRGRERSTPAFNLIVCLSGQAHEAFQWIQCSGTRSIFDVLRTECRLLCHVSDAIRSYIVMLVMEYPMGKTTVVRQDQTVVETRPPRLSILLFSSDNTTHSY
jgi:hypothetical protein